MRRDFAKHLHAARWDRVIEFEDGSVYREESKQMAETISAGALMEKRGGAPQGDAAS